MDFDREILCCPICCDYFNNAVETVCGHSFCEICLIKCLEHEETCPVCRKYPSPMHPSFTLRKIVEEFRKMSGLRKEQVSLHSLEEEKSLGNKFYSEGKYSEAIKHYNNALLIKPNPQIFANRAACWLKLKQYILAKEDCESAIHYDPNYIKAYVRKGLCHEHLGEWELAIQSLKKAQELDTSGKFTKEIEESLQRVQRLNRILNGDNSSSSFNHQSPNQPNPPQFHQSPNVHPYPQFPPQMNSPQFHPQMNSPQFHPQSQPNFHSEPNFRQYAPYPPQPYPPNYPGQYPSFNSEYPDPNPPRRHRSGSHQNSQHSGCATQ